MIPMAGGRRKRVLSAVLFAFLMLAWPSLGESGGGRQDVSVAVAETDSEVKHKGLFSPFSGLDFVAFTIIFVGSAIAAGAGLGGGILNTPILMSVAKFSASESIPLSSVCIFSAALVTFLLNLPLRRASADRPLIDFNTALIVQPLAMVGATIGMILNVVMVDWATLCILLLTISYTIYKMLLKTWSVWNKDWSGRARRRARRDTTQLDELEDADRCRGSGVEISVVPLQPNSENRDSFSEQSREKFASPRNTLLSDLHSGDQESHEKDVSDQQFPESAPPNFASLDKMDPSTQSSDCFRLDKLESAERFIPKRKILYFFLILSLSIAWALVVSGKSDKSIAHVDRCSPLYWGLHGLFLFVFSVVTLRIAVVMYKNYRKKVRFNFQFQDSDIRWNIKHLIATIIVGLASGILASLLGIGGGMVITPLMLELKVAPDCTAATSSFIILSTSLVSIAQYAVLGRVALDYAIALFIVGILASVTGNLVILKLRKKYNSQLFILIAMLMIAIPSSILLVQVTISELISNAHSGAQKQNLCPKT
ncbi:uncharacterized protein LOC126318632 [Schistocerca gregaria]|uniref:uncharacterized protein LOC126318632 n=1 Tax=Schistocerca gregaria TaxID=7010 RepID=UPI00211F0867|nr:uncharacterized protein LOC126318632 [Schistocerca gregaria]